ncbi:MAG TPA: dTDP-4-dehydrorhamnose reductase [Candidatus Baltobacteraceae bacterium]|nr:dTDP-4-dehydrorhamnose reductase [Candidatus Baltobacteraceae bacterium]
MRVLLIGGSGQLGTEIRARWRDDTIFAPSHAALDVLDGAAVGRALAAHRADLLVNCAAFHNVDACESQPAAAFAANASAVDAMAGTCRQHDAAFVTISTDYVFDGAKNAPYTEEDVPRPLSVYGVSKLAGELLVLRGETKAFVIRTCGVYGAAASRSKGTFIDRVIKQAQAGETIRAVSDVIASPTFAGHLAQAIRSLVASGKYGLYHACNAGAITWYDYAKKALELAEVDGAVEPISASEWKVAARRPSYSALANSKLETLGIVMPGWKEGIAAYLKSRQASGMTS